VFSRATAAAAAGLLLAVALASCARGRGVRPVALELTPPVARIALGTDCQFTATCRYSDSTVRDVTSQVAWTASPPSVARLGANAGGLATAAAVGTATITATDPASGLSGTAALTVSAAVLLSIAVTPASASLPVGLKRQFQATGTFSDQSVQDLTGSVTWASSAPACATITDAGSSRGLATSVGVGSTQITATDPSTGIFGGTSLTVSGAVLASLAVTPTNTALPRGLFRQFQATGTYTDQSVHDLTDAVTWSSSAPAHATIGNAPASAGLAMGVAVGSTQITATAPGTGIFDTTALDVTAAVLVAIAVTPQGSSLPAGLDRQFRADGTFSDSSVQDLTGGVTWSSSAPAHAAISNASGSRGLATAVAAGGTTITATDPDTGVFGTATLTVTAAMLVSLEVTPANPSVPTGLTRQFTATGTFTDSSVQDLTAAVTWTSSLPAHATISNAAGSRGLASCVAAGSTTVRATDAGSGIFGTTTLLVTPAALVSIAVTPANASLPAGLTQQFTATGTFTDSSQQDLTGSVTWASSQPGYATISNGGGSRGLASGVAVGATTITATDPGTSIFGTTTLLVTAAALVSLAVTPANASLPAGLTRQFTATGTFTDSSQQDLTGSVTWASSQPGYATISNSGGSRGLASGVAVGATTITATDPGTSIFGTTTLTVTAAALVSIAVTPANPSVRAGLTQQFTATGTFTDSSQQDLTTAVTWTSSATAYATVSNAPGTQGLASGVAAGATTITATHAASGIFGDATLTVTCDISFRAATGAGAGSGVLTLTIATPVGTAAGDVMLAAVAVRPNTAVITPPGGWTLVRRQDNAATNANSLAVYRRVALVNEPADHSWTLSTSTGAAGGIAAFCGVDTSTAIDVDAGQTTGSGLSHAAPSVTTTVTDTMLFTAHAFASAATWTPPASMTEAFDVASQAVGAAGESICGCYLKLPSAGATGSRTAAASNDADVGNGISVALRRAP